ncbi:helix-turn-helix domain-containing protein [Paenibacillus sp. LMG 31460]|uniref:Helix-turn-helix domain-containing protein n=1 Tax=Paenibacillus germinis TaxID=2654979 RepID=A0ABX1Z0G2_9BACL|nr:helix-turn-helix domain-containing protein [Paenibacillus germinis]NOU85448.1 helix-turn-helix domain-containing protein [Paenibacillus germinis]
MELLNQKSKSFLVRIFISFLTIIMLLSVFNFVLFSFFQQNIKQEIIRSNEHKLTQAAENYNSHFNRLRTVLFQMYHDNTITKFNGQLISGENGNANYFLVVDMVRKLRETAGNPLFYLDNLMVLYRSNLFMADKEGSSTEVALDSLTNFHAPYDLSYWEKEFERPRNYYMHPAQEYPLDHFSKENKTYIPFSFKLPNANYELIAMLDADKLNQTLLGDVPFIIQTEEGENLYRSNSSASIEEIPVFAAGESYKLFQNRYFFIHEDSENHLRYMTAVPYANIAAQISKLRVTQIVVLFTSIAIALGMSYWFSRRLQSPVKRIIASLQHPEGQHLRMESAIHEFETISNHIDKLSKERTRIHDELKNSNSLLTNYGYIAKLKSLHVGISEWREFVQAEGPFSLILYQLNARSMERLSEDIKRYIREYIEIVLSEYELNAYTFQIENDQIISVVFRQDKTDRMTEALQQVKETLDKDRQTCLIMMAVSSVFEQSAQLNTAYEQVSGMIKQARPLDETQIIVKQEPDVFLFVFTKEQEQELYAHLQAGNEKLCLHALHRMLEAMERSQATLAQFRQFSEAWASRIVKTLEQNRADNAVRDQVVRLRKELDISFTLTEFKQIFDTLVPIYADWVRLKKEEKDEVIEFVMKTMETQYSEDISLDQIAEKLDLSSAYLSVYIKEKTGANFSEHMNRMRIQKAKELLVGSSLSIQNIGEQIGYRNGTSFIRMFKKITGETPGEFRRCQTV